MSPSAVRAGTSTFVRPISTFASGQLPSISAMSVRCFIANVDLEPAEPKVHELALRVRVLVVPLDEVPQVRVGRLLDQLVAAARIASSPRLLLPRRNDERRGDLGDATVFALAASSSRPPRRSAATPRPSTRRSRCRRPSGARTTGRDRRPTRSKFDKEMRDEDPGQLSMCKMKLPASKLPKQQK